MMSTFLGGNPFPTFLTPSSSNHKPFQNKVIHASFPTPARDRVIDFGKYKGRMLGTLPSNYLKWVSNNLRARDFEDWAKLADQVLQDPVYQDRLEWELAHKLLNGDTMISNSMSQGAVAELLELSHRFGWDNHDKLAWSRIDLELLGTSKGGRIPRINAKKKQGELAVKEVKRVEDDDDAKRLGVDKGKRGVRRDRVRMKRQPPPKVNERLGSNGSAGGGKSDGGTSEQNQNVGVYNPFPGRESLLRKALSRRNSL